MKKRIFAFMTAVLLLTLSFSFLCFAKVKPETRQVPRLVDEANLISDGEEKNLLSRLDSISEELRFDFVVATVLSTYGSDVAEFSDDYFDYNGFGYGDGNSGVALIISLNPRAVYISGCGEGTKYFDYEDAQRIIDVFYDELKEGNYESVVETFIDEAYNSVDFGRNGMPFGVKLRNFFSNWKKAVIIPAVVAIALAFVTMVILTRGHKTVRMKNSASDYEVPGSLFLTRSEDRFLYSTVSRTAKPRDTDSPSSGGSSFGSSGTHIGSSGAGHSGGGRSF